jgi:hypothetical protein
MGGITAVVLARAVLATLLCGAASRDLLDVTRDVAAALTSLHTAALQAHWARCAVSCSNTSLCSFDACGTSQPPAMACSADEFDAPPMCSAAGEVCVCTGSPPCAHTVVWCPRARCCCVVDDVRVADRTSQLHALLDAAWYVTVRARLRVSSQMVSFSDSSVRLATGADVSDELVRNDVCAFTALNSAFVANRVSCRVCCAGPA